MVFLCLYLMIDMCVFAHSCGWVKLEIVLFCSEQSRFKIEPIFKQGEQFKHTKGRGKGERKIWQKATSTSETRVR